jgi:hypothetical protein
MFTKAVIRSSHFMRMPLDAQFLYLQMLLDADDDGFIANPELEVTIAKCAQEDLQTLIEKQYLMVFPSGIALIRHWFLHNYIRKERYRASVYPEKRQVTLTKERVYIWLEEESDAGTPGIAPPEPPPADGNFDEDPLWDSLCEDV